MARADLLKKLFSSFKNDDKELFIKTAHEIIADERKKNHCSLPSKTQKSDTQNTKNRSDLSDLRKPERFFLCNIIF